MSASSTSLAHSRRENLLVFACAFIRFAICCYRAAHQSITIDEATTYNQFVSGPWNKLFGPYDANNHILSSFLIKLTVTIGGLNEFTIRFPSLIAGLFLTIGVFWLLKQAKSPILRWIAFAVFCTYPMIFDFSIVARGYSLSLAFFVWALYFAIGRRYRLAGFLIGLSIAANLATVFPSLALISVVILFERKEEAFLNLVVPAFLTAGLITGHSLWKAQRGQFYIGYPELHTAVSSFVFTSLHPSPSRDGILGGTEEANWIAWFGLPLLGLLAAGLTLWGKDLRRLIPLLTLAITLIGLMLARWLFAVNYPADRTCLYFPILALVAWAIAGDALKNRYLLALCVLPGLLLVIQFCTQLQMGSFQFWRSEADNRQIATLIQQASAGKSPESLTLSTNWLHQPALEFYRRYLHIEALKPIDRLEPTPLTGFDFYVLSGGDLDRIKTTNLRVVFEDPDAGIILAEP
jgi:hypothetical protein